MRNVYKNSVNISQGFNAFAKTMMSITDLNKTCIDLLSMTMEKALDSITPINQRLCITAAYNLILQDAIGNYLDQVQDRVIALTSLNHHLLTPSLVAPAQLQTVLNGIEKELLRNYAPFKFGFDLLDYFYSVPSTTYLAIDDYLYVEINIPLSVISAHYHIYEVYSVPLSAGEYIPVYQNNRTGQVLQCKRSRRHLCHVRQQISHILFRCGKTKM